MTNFLTQISIFGVLLSFLVVGFLYKKRPQNFKEYVLGKGKISTPVLVATMIATAVGGGTIIGISSTLYEQGVWFFLATALPISYCIMSLIIIPKLSKYYGCYSISEVMGCMYGTRARKIIGITAFLFCIGALAAQIKALHWTIEHAFGQNALIVTLLVLTIIMLYSSIGGVSSVIRTDVLQFIIFLVIVPSIAYYMINTSGGITEIVKSLPANKSSFLPQKGIWVLISIIVLNLLPDLYPASFHRFLIGRDCKKNQTTAYALALVDFLSKIFACCVAFIAISKFPNILPKEVIFKVVQGAFSSNWIMVLFITALIAIITSTADSLINTGSIVLVNDVITQKITDKQKLKLLPGLTILCGIVATCIALLFSSVIDIVLFFAEYYVLVVTVPLIAGLFLKKLQKETFWSSVIAGVGAFSILHFIYRDLSHEIFLISISVSFLAYFFTCFFVKKNKLQKSNFSFNKICNGIVAKFPIQEGETGLVILGLYFCAFLLKGKYEMGETINLLEWLSLGILGSTLVFAHRISESYRGVVVLSILWYCCSFFPMRVFLNCPAILVTVWLISSSLFLAYLFKWELFLGFILSGVVVSSVISYVLNQELTIAPLINLCLIVGSMCSAAYMFSKKKNYKIIQKELRNASCVFKRSSDAEKKYRNILLKEDKTMLVSFEDLKTNILEYFHFLKIERGTQLTVNNINNKSINTKLPLCVFYKIINSLIFNVFYCGKNEQLSIQFYCDRASTLKKIAINHGNYKILGRLECLQDSRVKFYEEILTWEVLKQALQILHMDVKEEFGSLTIFPPVVKQTRNDNVIYLKELLREEN